MKTGIIIPCYNVAMKLNVEVYTKFIAAHENYHWCFVNNGSKDNTLKVLNQIKRMCPQLVSIVDVKKYGDKNAAVRAGVRYLYNNKELNFIGFIVAELFTDFDDLKKVAGTLENNGELDILDISGNKIERRIERNLILGLTKVYAKGLIKRCIAGLQEILDYNTNATKLSFNWIELDTKEILKKHQVCIN